jgi:putative ABC transport system permease protein
MVKNYFKIALRNLTRHKSFSAIIIGSLALAICCCLLIFLWIQDEISYDKFHTNLDRIYRITGRYDLGGNEATLSTYTNYNTAPSFKESFPNIEFAARIGPDGGNIVVDENVIENVNSCLADHEIFDVFSLELVKGDRETILLEPNTLVITAEIAQTHFADVDPIGIVVEYNGIPHTITGIIKALPSNSHFHFDYFISMALAPQYYDDPTLNNWSSLSMMSYVLLTEGSDPNLIKQNLMNDYLLKYFGEYGTEQYEYFFQPVKDIHLHSHLRGELETNGDIRYIWIFGTVALVILLFACINYINLITVKSIRRAREVGIRKVVGAGRKNLMFQFLTESIITTLVSFILAILAVELILPHFNQFFTKQLSLAWQGNTVLWISICGVIILLGIITGSYPAFVLSAFKPVDSLKGSKFSKGGNVSVIIGRILIVFQFMISIALLVSVGIIINQVNFMKTTDLGFNQDQLLQIYAGEAYQNGNYEDFKAALKNNSNIISVGGANQTSGREAGNWRPLIIDGYTEGDYEVLPIMIVDQDYFSTLEVKFASGRDFSFDHPSDVQAAYIMNEAAVRKYSFEEPLGIPIQSWMMTNDGQWSEKSGELIGVVKDYHLASLHKEIQPVLYYLHTPQTTSLSSLLIRINGNNVQSILEFIEETTLEYQPDIPFEFSFLEDSMNVWYDQEERFLQLLTIFVMITIIIAVLGIYGLSGYSVQQRTQEIGIRKVLGASPLQITKLISRQYFINLIIANIVAWPIGYYMMQKWLQNFAFKIQMNIFYFLIAGFLTVAIAILTISFQTMKAANTNPVEALKYE